MEIEETRALVEKAMPNGVKLLNLTRTEPRTGEDGSVIGPCYRFDIEFYSRTLDAKIASRSEISTIAIDGRSEPGLHSMLCTLFHAGMRYVLVKRIAERIGATFAAIDEDLEKTSALGIGL